MRNSNGHCIPFVLFFKDAKVRKKRSLKKSTKGMQCPFEFLISSDS